MHRKKHVPGNSFYCVSVTGSSHLELQTLAVLAGGHVRVGTEDEPYLSAGVLGDNGDHVARIATIAGSLGRSVASVEETKTLLKIPPR